LNGNSCVGGNKKDSLRIALPHLLLLTLVFFLTFIARVIFSPLLPEIEKLLGIDHGAAGSLFLFISIGYFISILLSSKVSEWIGHKNTIVLSVFSCGVILILIGTFESLLAIRMGLFLLGYGAGLYLQSGLATILALVSPAYAARGMSVHELAPNLGFVIAPLLCTTILLYYSYHVVLYSLGTLLICVAGIYMIYGYNGVIETRGMDRQSMRTVLKMVSFWQMVVLLSLAICSTLGLYSMLPLYLITEHGMEKEAANTLVAFSRVSSVFMPLVGGWMGDRIGNGRVLRYILFAAGILTIPFGLLSGIPLLVFVVVQPMVAVCFFPSAFAVLSRLGGSVARGTAVALCVPLAFLIGGGVLPMCIGFMGDYFSLAAGFSVVGVMTAGIALIVGRGKQLLVPYS
jgi:NNP family nitrate/nitrite transporter-like MFS transporter